MDIEAGAVDRRHRYRFDVGANDGMECAEESALREIMNDENEVNYAVNMAKFSMVQ
jgi:hypothetical protein